MRLEIFLKGCYDLSMVKIPEIKLLEARRWHRCAPPETPFAAKGRDFLLLFVASGLRRGHLHLPDGRNPYRVPPQGAEGLLLLVPPGAEFKGVFSAVETEARAFSFRCPISRARSDAPPPTTRRSRRFIWHATTFCGRRCPSRKSAVAWASRARASSRASFASRPGRVPGPYGQKAGADRMSRSRAN